jgi:hypothetical protein
VLAYAAGSLVHKPRIEFAARQPLDEIEITIQEIHPGEHRALHPLNLFEDLSRRFALILRYRKK